MTDDQNATGYLNFAGNKKLILVDTSTTRSYALIDFKLLPRTYIHKYQWIDNDTLFLGYGDADSADDIAFVDFRFVDGIPVPEITRTSARGVLVDPLQSVEDTVLFAWEPDPRQSGYILYTVTVDQLHDSSFRPPGSSAIACPMPSFIAGIRARIPVGGHGKGRTDPALVSVSMRRSCCSPARRTAIADYEQTNRMKYRLLERDNG